MSDKLLAHKLKKCHGQGKSELYPGYNHGRGRVHLTAILEGGDEPDYPVSPKGEKGRFGWDFRRPAFNYSIVSRWLHAQVGRHIDDVRSDIAAMCRRDNSVSRRAFDFDRVIYSEIHGDAQLVSDSDRSGYWRVRQVTPSGHRGDILRTQGDVYLDAKGYLRQVDPALLQEADRRNKATRTSRHRFASVTWVDGKAYYRMNGAWQALSIVMVERRRIRGTVGWAWHYDRAEACHLCAKLGLGWDENHWALFGEHCYCTAIRTLSRREAARAGLLD